MNLHFPSFNLPKETQLFGVTGFPHVGIEDVNHSRMPDACPLHEILVQILQP